jgi:hypothetical protein
MSGGSGSPAGTGGPAEQPAAVERPQRDGIGADRHRETETGEFAARVVALVERVSGLFEAHLGIDARALAAFRIALGAILVTNLVLRARYMTAFHTDAGVLPRSLLAAVYPPAAKYSLFAQVGSTEAQAVLFFVFGLVSIALLVGYRSTLAAVASLLFLVSLNVRNPLVLTGGDFLLVHLLFWAILLPIGERWSVDALRGDRRPRAWIASLATAGLLLQVVVVYSVNAAHKHAGSTWPEGVAMQYVFRLDHVTVLLGDYLAGVTPLLVALNYLWFWMVTVSILLVVLRGWPRAAFASLFVGGHATMLLTMHIGIFAPVSIAALLVFYPPPVWDLVERHAARPLSTSLTRVRAALEARARTRVVPRPSWSSEVAVGWRSLVVPLVAALALSTITVGNAALLESGESERWQMFAPDPPRTAAWTTMGATTASGAHLDAFPFRATNVTADRPPDLADTYPTVRWGRYYLALDHLDARFHRQLADYVCRRWNATHEDPLLTVSITQHTERVRLHDTGPIRRETLIEYDCTTASRLSG